MGCIGSRAAVASGSEESASTWAEGGTDLRGARGAGEAFGGGARWLHRRSGGVRGLPREGTVSELTCVRIRDIHFSFGQCSSLVCHQI